MYRKLIALLTAALITAGACAPVYADNDMQAEMIYEEAVTDDTAEDTAEDLAEDAAVYTDDNSDVYTDAESEDQAGDDEAYTSEDAENVQPDENDDALTDDDADGMTLDEVYNAVKSIDKSGMDPYSAEPQGYELTEEQGEAIRRIIYFDRTGEELPQDGDLSEDDAEYYASDLSGSSDYFYRQISGTYKKICDKMVSESKRFMNSNTDLSSEYFAYIDFDTPLTKEQARTVFRIFYYSNPQYFFVGHWYGYNVDLSGKWTGLALVCYDKCYSHTTRNTIKNNIESKTDAWIAEAMKYTSVVDRERCLARKIAENVDYKESDYDQSMMSAVNYGSAVCTGYAFTMEYLCGKIGIECFIITCGRDKDDKTSHAWNAVKLNGDWYLADVTWYDDLVRVNGKLTGNLDEQYLNKSSSTFLKADQGYFGKDSHPMYDYRFDYTQYTMPVFSKDLSSDQWDPNKAAPSKPKVTIKTAFGGRTVTFTCSDSNAEIYYNIGSSNITTYCNHVKSGGTVFLDKPMSGSSAAIYFKAYNGKWSPLGKWGVLNVKIAKPIITQSGAKSANNFKIYTQTKNSYIVYTLDGSTPSINQGSQKLSVRNGRIVWGTSAVVNVPKGRTVKAIAIRNGLVTSDVTVYSNK